MNGPWLRWLYNVSTKKIPKLEFFRFFATAKNCEACKRHRPTTQIPYKIHSMDLLFIKWIHLFLGSMNFTRLNREEKRSLFAL